MPTKFKNFITRVNENQNTGSGHWFGSATLQLGGKDSREWHKFTVCNHLKQGKEYEFRSVGKCQAGFTTIYDFKCKAEHLWYHVSKSTTCIQVKLVFPTGDVWVHCFCTKGGLWHTVDLLMLDTAKIGDMHSAAPKMISWATHEQAHTKYHTCLAFVDNKKYKTKKAA